MNWFNAYQSQSEGQQFQALLWCDLPDENISFIRKLCFGALWWWVYLQGYLRTPFYHPINAGFMRRKHLGGFKRHFIQSKVFRSPNGGFHGLQLFLIFLSQGDLIFESRAKLIKTILLFKDTQTHTCIHLEPPMFWVSHDLLIYYFPTKKAKNSPPTPTPTHLWVWHWLAKDHLILVWNRIFNPIEFSLSSFTLGPCL